MKDGLYVYLTDKDSSGETVIRDFAEMSKTVHWDIADSWRSSGLHRESWAYLINTSLGKTVWYERFAGQWQEIPIDAVPYCVRMKLLLGV